MRYALQLPQLKVLWKAWKRREFYGMLYGKLEECCRIEATLIDLLKCKCVSSSEHCEFDGRYCFLLRLDGAGSSGCHSPQSEAIWLNGLAYWRWILPTWRISLVTKWLAYLLIT